MGKIVFGYTVNHIHEVLLMERHESKQIQTGTVHVGYIFNLPQF